MYTIYGLIDPLSYYVRYIGVTNKHLEVRLDQHTMLKDGCKTKVQWLTTLVDLGLKPTIFVLGYAKDKDTAYQIEKDWILKGYSFGWPLTNGTNRDSEQDDTKSFTVPESTRDLAVIQHLKLGDGINTIVKKVYGVDGKGVAYQDALRDIYRIISENLK